MAADKIDFPVKPEYVKTLTVIEDNIVSDDGNEIFSKGDTLTKGTTSFHSVFETPSQIRTPTSLTQQEEDTGEYDSGNFLIEAWDYENMPLGDTQWVATDGDDSNPGTKEEPVASIQTAIDRLSKVDISGVRRVNVEPGEYDERLFINRPNFHIRSTKIKGIPVNISPSSLPENKPVVVLTDMTKEGWDAFQSDGGIDYDFSGGNYTWTGGDTHQERHESFSGSFSRITLEGLELDSGNSSGGVGGLAVIGSLNDDDDHNFGYNQIKDSKTTSYASSTACCVFKNSGQPFFEGTNFNSGDAIFDNCHNMRFSASSINTVFWCDNIVYKSGGVGEKFPGSFIAGLYSLEPNFLANVYLKGGGQLLAEAVSTSMSVDMGRNEYHHDSSANIGLQDAPIDLKCGLLEVTDGGDMYVRDLDCSDFSWGSSGTADVNHIQCSGNVDIQAGTGHIIRGGTIEGNLNVAAGVDVTLVGVTVRGDLTGSGTVNMEGGGYLGANNVGTFNHTPLKTT